MAIGADTRTRSRVFLEKIEGSIQGARASLVGMDLLEGLTEDELEFAAQNGDAEVRRAIAMHPTTSVNTLYWLAQEGFVDEVEKNPMLLFFLESMDETAFLIFYEIARQAKEDRLEEFSRSEISFTRLGVADNVHVSPKLLDRLSMDEHPDVQWSVASNPKTSPASLARLADHKDANWRAQVAQNSNAPEALLLVLSKDDHYLVRHGVASNKNTPNKILTVLSKDKHEDVRLSAKRILTLKQSRKQSRKENPMVDLKDKTEEELEIAAKKGDDKIRRAVARCPTTGLKTLAWLAMEGFVEEVVQNPMLPLYQEVGGDEVDTILFELARQTKDMEVIERFSISTDKNLRCGVASNRSTDRRIMTRLSKDKDDDVRFAVANNESATPDVLASLVKDISSDVRHGVSNNTNTPAVVLEQLAEDSSWVVRASIASNANTPKFILTLLTKDSNVGVRSAARDHLKERKQNPVLEVDDDTTEEELARIATHGTNDEKRVAAMHPNSRVDTLLILARAGFAEEVDQNPLMPLYIEGGSMTMISILEQVARASKNPARLDELARFNWESVRAFVASNEHASVSTLTMLYKESNVGPIRQSLARNKMTPEDILRDFCKSRNDGFILNVSENPSAPKDILENLASHRWSMVRIGVAWNPSTPAHVLESLSKSSDAQVRKAVASNRSAPVEVLEHLANDPDSMVYDNVAENKKCPQDVLHRIAMRSSKYGRRNVALNKNSSVETLTMLMEDKDEQTRTNAKKTLDMILSKKDLSMDLESLTEDELDKLAAFGTDEEKRAVARHPNASLQTLLYLAHEGFVDEIDQNPLIIFHFENGSFDAVILLQIIADKTNRPERLQELACSNFVHVRKNVAWNRNTPRTSLSMLANDENTCVRYGIACNINTPKDVLSVLAEDKDESIRHAVAKNASAPIGTLTLLSKCDLWTISLDAMSTLLKLRMPTNEP